MLTIACDARDSSRYEQSSATITESESPIGTSGDAARAAGADAELFARQAMMANKAEAQLGELAEQRAQSPAVKEFARMMVRDHTSGLSSLKQAVKSYDIDEPARLDEKHQTLYDRLSALKGAEFDREYMKAMVDGHREVKDMVDDRADDTPTPKGTSGSAADNSPIDTAVNQWASQVQPTIARHLEKAEQISRDLK
jgi:putative membrane protein